MDFYKLIELRESLRKKGKFLWFGLRAIDMRSFDYFVPIDYVVSWDYGQDVQNIEKTKQLFSAEKVWGTREVWSDKYFDRVFDKRMHSHFMEKIKNEEKLFIIPYRSNETLERIAKEMNGKAKLFSVPVALKRKLDNKIYLRYLLSKAGIEPVEGEVFASIKHVDYDELSKKYGEKMILQLPVAALGRGTFMITSQKDLEWVIDNEGDSDCIMAKYIRGPSVSLHGCVLTQGNRTQVVVSHPCPILIGAPECGNNLFAFGGCDASASKKILNPQQKAHFIDMTIRLGKQLAKEGWRGIFGIDIIMDSETGKGYITDLNPRFTGSSQMVTESQIDSSVVPLAFFHVMEFLGEKIDPEYVEAYNKKAHDDYRGSMLIVKNLAEHDVIIEKSVKAGIYKIENGKLRFLRDGLSISDCINDDEFVLTSGVPRDGDIIREKGKVMNIQTWRGVLDDSGKNLKPESADLVRLVYNSLKLRNPYTKKEGSDFVKENTEKE